MPIPKHEIAIMTGEDKLKEIGAILARAHIRYQQTPKWYRLGVGICEALLDNPKQIMQHFKNKAARNET